MRKIKPNAEGPKIHCLYDELVDPKTLKYHPKNRNKHPKDQIERLAKILEYQGWRYPIKVSKLSGCVTSGHGRIAAAFLKKWNQVPVVFQEYENADQEYADVQSDNAIASWAELDLAAINLDIPDIGPDFDIDLLGIKDFTIDAADKYADKDADAVPETEESFVKRGDLWILGNHRLLCGDATSKEDVDRLMNGEKADMVFTDPPYNHASDEKLLAQSVRQAMKKLSEAEWDKGFSFASVTHSLETMLADNSSVYVCTSWHLAGSIWEWMKARSSCSGYCVWHKPNPMPSLAKRHWTWATELVCYATFGKHTFNFPAEGHASNVWSFNKSQKNDLHPTMKPVEMVEHPINHSSKAGDIVGDLFLGSGSTLIACEKTNRKCFGMEIDPHYCQVIIDRWEKFTGQKATKA